MQGETDDDGRNKPIFLTGLRSEDGARNSSWVTTELMS